MKKTMQLLWRCAVKPSSVFTEIATDPKTLNRAIALYAAAIAAAVISDMFKPAGFPQPEYPAVTFSASLYTNAVLGTLNTAACIVFLSSFISLGRKLSKPLFVLASAVLLGAPLIAFAFFLPHIKQTSPLFGSALLAWFAITWLLARDSSFHWREATTVLLLANVFTLYVLPFDIISSCIRNETFYKAAQYAAGFWMLWFSIAGIKRTEKTTAPHAAAGIVGSMLMGLGFLCALALLGLVSQEHLNAMMSL